LRKKHDKQRKNKGIFFNRLRIAIDFNTITH
jgi:hypothetical protein